LDLGFENYIKKGGEKQNRSAIPLKVTGETREGWTERVGTRGSPRHASRGFTEEKENQREKSRKPDFFRRNWGELKHETETERLPVRQGMKLRKISPKKEGERGNDHPRGK